MERENEIALPPDAPTVNLELLKLSAKPDNGKMALYVFLRKVSETLLGHGNEKLRVIVEDHIHNLQPLKHYWHEDDYKRCRGYFEDVSTCTKTVSSL